MKKLPINENGLNASELVFGCMGLGGSWDRQPIEPEHVKQAHEAVEAALASGINMFDHADIYTLGKAETVFGQVLKEKPGLREEIIIQSKCGIRFGDQESGLPTRYDFSKSYILDSVDGILSRLGIEYLDILLLHRPDPSNGSKRGWRSIPSAQGFRQSAFIRCFQYECWTNTLAAEAY